MEEKWFSVISPQKCW